MRDGGLSLRLPLWLFKLPRITLKTFFRHLVETNRHLRGTRQQVLDLRLSVPIATFYD